MEAVQDIEETEVEPVEGETEEQKTERANKLRKAYSNATTRLRESYRAEFDSLYVQEAQQLGVNYTPKPSPEQKAEQELRALLEAHPGLRDRMDDIIAEAEGGETA